MKRGYDVRNKIVDLLKNGGTSCVGKVYNSFADNLTLWDAERSTSTPAAKETDYRWGQNQLPYIIVDRDAAEVFNDEEITNEFDLTMNVMKFNILFVIKGSSNKVQDYAENYLDSIIDTLHGWNDENIMWLLVTGTDTADLYQKKNETEKSGIVTIEARVN